MEKVVRIKALCFLLSSCPKVAENNAIFLVEDWIGGKESKADIIDTASKWGNF